MPSYDYRCDECGREFEVHHSMNESYKGYCCADPTCSGGLQRVYTATPAVFKGSGWAGKSS